MNKLRNLFIIIICILLVSYSYFGGIIAPPPNISTVVNSPNIDREIKKKKKK